MNLDWIEAAIRLAGGLLAYCTLGIVLYGIWRGTRRDVGRVSGKAAGWLRSVWFYAFSSMIFVALSVFGWKSIPLDVSSGLRTGMLTLGSLLLFAGLGLLLWGRLSLGSNYFVSTSKGAQLFAGHQLVTSGPYAFMRHPMYSGLLLAAWGSLLVYITWTALGFAIFAPFILLRARREDAALEAEFGDEWREYRSHVQGFFPRIGKEG